MNENNNPVSPTSVLVFGIISLATSAGVVGIIFGILAIVKAKAYYAAGGEASGKVKAGKILGIVGLICGILAIVIYIICAIAAAAATAALGAYY